MQNRALTKTLLENKICSAKLSPMKFFRHFSERGWVRCNIVQSYGNFNPLTVKSFKILLFTGIISIRGERESRRRCQTFAKPYRATPVSLYVSLRSDQHFSLRSIGKPNQSLQHLSCIIQPQWHMNASAYSKNRLLTCWWALLKLHVPALYAEDFILKCLIMTG